MRDLPPPDRSHLRLGTRVVIIEPEGETMKRRRVRRIRVPASLVPDAIGKDGRLRWEKAEDLTYKDREFLSRLVKAAEVFEKGIDEVRQRIEEAIRFA